MIEAMSNPEPVHRIDWIAATLRWITLLGMALAMAASESFSLATILAFIGAALVYAIFTLLAAFKQLTPGQRLYSVAVDLAIASLLFYLSGTFNGNLTWAGLLPLISASLYFQMKGALLVSVLNLIFQGSLAWISAQTAHVFILLIMPAVLYLGIGIILGSLSQRINEILSQAIKEQNAAQRENERKERERRRSIYNLISALNASLNYQRVLDTALDLSTSALSLPKAATDRLVSAVLLFSGNGEKTAELHIGSARRFTSADLRITLPGTSGLIGQTIENGKPQLCSEISQDPELGHVVALRTCMSAYCLPLRTGINTYGVLLFAHPEPNFFNNEYCEILDIVCNQAVIAIQNARLYQELEQEKERMLEIQEESRKKMARDLHDGPTQSVAAIAMRVNFARHLLDRDSKATAEELFKIEELARRTTKEIRHMLFTLRPLVLESQGLVAALNSMAEKMRETYNQSVVIQVDQRMIDELEVGKQGVIFYIAEEAVNNARKHANAVHVWVRLKSLGHGLGLLEIEDDGIGFDLKAMDAEYEKRGSLGMVNMRERAELLNGILHIESVVGRGTRIQVAVPLTEEAADHIRRGL